MREPRHRVDLVDDGAVVGQEEVDAGKTLAVDRAERPDREPAHLVGDVVVDLGRHVEFGGVLEVFGGEVVERVLASAHARHPDFADGARFDAAVGEFQYAAFEFAARHGRLDDHLRVVFARIGDRAGS